MKKTIKWMMIGLLMGVFLVGCGQGTTKEETEQPTGNEQTTADEEKSTEEEVTENEETANQGTSQSEQMTATFIGLIDSNSFEVETEDGTPIAVRFSEQFYDELESFNGNTITFAYEINENDQYVLTEIIEKK